MLCKLFLCTLDRRTLERDKVVHINLLNHAVIFFFNQHSWSEFVSGCPLRAVTEQLWNYFSCVTVHLVQHWWLWLCVGVNGQLTLGSPATTACYLVESCHWEMSGDCLYHSLSLASAQTKNTLTNIHLPCPACMLTLFILADPYVRCTRELKGLYDHWLGKTTGGWVALYTAFFQRPLPAHRAPPVGSACLRESEREKLKNTLIWCHGLFHQPACQLKGSLCLHSGQLEQ